MDEFVAVTLSAAPALRPRAALAESRGTHPGTLKHIEAWVAVERATRRRGELVAESDAAPVEIRALVRAAAARVRRET